MYHTRMITLPTIGILMDYQAEGTFSKRPHYALRCAYFDAIWKAGGLPVALPYLTEAADDYLERLDGMILPGGFYPFPAAAYDDPPPPGEEVHPRARFETGLTRRALDQDLPLLGICAGLQTMAVAMGGTMYRNVHDDPGTDIDHLNGRPAEDRAHGVSIIEGTRLYEILGTTEMEVNTAHSEALKDIPAGLVVNATAPDGVIEGAEAPDKRFCVGVQWHPEFFTGDDDPDFRLFTALIDAAGAAAE